MLNSRTYVLGEGTPILNVGYGWRSVLDIYIQLQSRLSSFVHVIILLGEDLHAVLLAKFGLGLPRLHIEKLGAARVNFCTTQHSKQEVEPLSLSPLRVQSSIDRLQLRRYASPQSNNGASFRIP